MDAYRLGLPEAGAANSTTFEDTDRATSPLSGLSNARRYTDPHDRPQIGSRDGLKLVFDLGTGSPVQAMAVAARGSIITDYTRGDCTDLADGFEKFAGTLTGNWWVLDEVPSLYDAFLHSGSKFGGPDGAVNAVAVSPSGNLVAVSSNITIGSDQVGAIGIRRIDNGELFAQAILQEAGIDRFVNTMAWGPPKVLAVCTNNKIQFYDIDEDNSSFATRGNFFAMGWSQEFVEASWWFDEANSQWYLFGAFNGSTKAATVVNDTQTFSVDAGEAAGNFRAGVVKLKVDLRADGTLDTFTQIEFGGPTPLDDPWLEALHGYWRISEHNPTRPYGRRVTAMRTDPSGNVILCTTNQGYGPNATFTPDGTLRQNITVWKIAANGTLAWFTDPYNIIETGLGGFINDIPTGGSDDPSILAVAVDRDGDIYVGGREGQDGNSIYRLGGDNGVKVWGQDIMGSSNAVRQAAVSVDPASQHIVFGGDRNNSWTGASGVNAHLWQIDRLNGAIRWSWDLPTSVSALAVAHAPDGRIAYGTDLIS